MTKLTEIMNQISCGLPRYDDGLVPGDHPRAECADVPYEAEATPATELEWCSNCHTLQRFNIGEYRSGVAPCPGCGMFAYESRPSWPGLSARDEREAQAKANLQPAVLALAHNLDDLGCVEWGYYEGDYSINPFVLAEALDVLGLKLVKADE